MPLIQVSIFFPIDINRKIFPITERSGERLQSSLGSLLSKGSVRRPRHPCWSCGHYLSWYLPGAVLLILVERQIPLQESNFQAFTDASAPRDGCL